MKATLVVCGLVFGCAAAPPMPSSPGPSPAAAPAASASAVAHAALPSAPKCAQPSPTDRCAELVAVPNPPAACKASAANAASASSSASAEAAPPPPPKPAQSGLSHGSSEPFDLELAAGDRAYEADDLALAKAHYDKARRPGTEGPGGGDWLGARRLGRERRAHGFCCRAGKNPGMLALLRKVDAALKLDDSYAPAYVERGRLLLIVGSGAEALSALDRAQRLAPDDAETQSALGVALHATGKPAEALTRLRRAAELDPDNAERLTNLGTAFLIQGEVAEAVRAFTRAAVLEPNERQGSRRSRRGLSGPESDGKGAP